ncbi:MAG: sugar O-acetyltransferase [Tannerella sp.]|jgi:maltose O-acetyltransferase|nr:sugar O-acetyltransferase [Tannerella sp.]
MKTEKQKMLAGESYDGGDPELLNRWHKAKQLTQLYNAADTTDHKRLMLLLDELLGSHGEKVWITAPFFVDYGENIHLGENCEINCNCVFLDCNTITIGKNALIGPNVQIYAVGHPVKASDRFPISQTEDFAFCQSITAPVTIGDNVWIGGNSVILPGVSIGNNVTIGAGSVVTKSIPDNSLAVGNPCRVIRNL